MVTPYDGNNRLVGRTAQAASVTSLTAGYDSFSWNLETRPEVIAADGIPAETTFVWDPVSDRIIAVMRTGNSVIANDPNNNTLKQIIHGDMGYDDPLEVTTVDTSVVVGPGQAQPVTKLYPVYDEAAGGTLQVVLNKNLEVVARSINNDPFGGAEFDLAGAAIDHVEVQATKNAQGTLDSVAVTMRATEQLTAASIAAGTRLAVVDAAGTVVRTSTAQPTLSSDAFTVKWTLTAAELTALSDPAAVAGKSPVSLSIAATNTLRASLWKFDLPILPAPDWATASKSVYASSTLPVEVRESLANITSTIGALTAGQSRTTVSYDVPNLGVVGAAGNDEVENLLAATFQAQPFAEPFTGKFYVRERWYDPQTGTWLTPDCLGYQDSANVYAYAGGDPVNGRDPTGLAASMGRSGWIVATDNRHGGGIRRFSPAEIAADPQKVRAFLGLNADVDPREADAMIERAGAAWATGGDKMRIVAPGAAKAAGVYPLMAMTAGAGIGGGAGVVVSGELGLGFVGSTMLPGFTGGVGGQAGSDINAGHFSGVRQYAVSGSVGAVTGLVIGSVFAGGQRFFGTPDVIPSIAPQEGWAPPLPANVARTFTNGQYTSRVLEHDLVGYRGEGSRFGRWLGPVRPSSAADAERMYNVIDYGSDLIEVSEYVIPKGTLIYEGPVAGGTGTQVYVANPRAVGVRLVGTQPLPQYGY